jgi:hypothetical protein
MIKLKDILFENKVPDIFVSRSFDDISILLKDMKVSFKKGE